MSASSPASASLFIDDLPSVAISRLVAEQKITRHATRARIHLDGVTGEFAVSRVDFPNGGWWAFVICHCGQPLSQCFGFTTAIFVVGAVYSGVGLGYRCKYGDSGPRIARLRERLSSPRRPAASASQPSSRSSVAVGGFSSAG